MDSDGYDINSVENVSVLPHSRAKIRTGLVLEIPSKYTGTLHSRFGLAAQGIDVGAGVIDANFRGEVEVLLINTTGTVFEVAAGDAIAQLLLSDAVRLTTSEVDHRDHLSVSARGVRGCGSTDKFQL